MEKVQEVLEKGKFKRYDTFIDRLLDNGHTPTDIANVLFTLLDDTEGRPPDIAEDKPAPAGRSAASKSGKYPSYEPRHPAGPPARREDPPFERHDKRSPRKENVDPNSQSHEPGMMRLAMNAGKEHLIRPADVVGFILNETGIPREALGAIHIMPKQTLLDVREEHVATVLARAPRLRFKGRKLHIQPA